MRTALVTGANRGIGFEICRQLSLAGLNVTGTCRRDEEGQAAAQLLRHQGAAVHFEQADLADADSITRLLRRLDAEGRTIDILINNAGVFLDNRKTLLETERAVFEETFRINTLAPMQLAQGLMTGMMRRRFGRVVNVSSGMGQFDSLDGWAAAYRLSKAALNALTVMLAETGRDHNVLVNAVCPGWVKTSMGGPGAQRELSKGAETPVWLALRPDESETGKMWRDKLEIPF